MVLEPVVNVPRRTIGKLALINPDELNGKINYFTTSGFKGSSEHERNIIMIKEMANLEGKMVFGSEQLLPYIVIYSKKMSEPQNWGCA